MFNVVTTWYVAKQECPWEWNIWNTLYISLPAVNQNVWRDATDKKERSDDDERSEAEE
jgi:hypothetical protein